MRARFAELALVLQRLRCVVLDSFECSAALCNQLPRGSACRKGEAGITMSAMKGHVVSKPTLQCRNAAFRVLHAA